jgi:hypothetical protein
VAHIRYEQDTVAREVAGLRARVDAIGQRLSFATDTLTREMRAIRTDVVHSIDAVVTELRAITGETLEASRATLAQVQVAQEQQGRMLRELEELKARVKP